MNIREWNQRYAESVDAIQRMIPKIRGIITAYNSNIDAIIHVRTSDLDEILKEDPALLNNLVAKLGKPPRQILVKEDLLVGLIECIKNGIGDEWIIKNRDVYSWMESAFKYDQLRMGGQAGIIANALAKLNVPSVIVHASSLPEVQASLFLDNVEIPTKRNERVVLENPMNAVRPDDEKPVHYVFEFDKGTHINIGKHFESPRANRFVATWDPKNTELRIDPAFLELTIKSKADMAVLSGYHLLKPKYEDGSTHIDKITYTIRQIKSWKEEDPEFFIHLEMGDNKYGEIYASTLTLLSPYIDSVGLNENELLKACLSLKIVACAKETFNAVTAFKMAKNVLETLNVSTILVHTLDFSLAIVKRRKNQSTKTIRNIQSAILFGSLLAAVRAITCEYNDIERVKKEVNNPHLFLSPKGIKEHHCLADYLEKSYNASRKDFLSMGYIQLKDCYVVFVVSKITNKPATTAGLGDSLIAGYILGVKDDSPACFRR